MLDRERAATTTWWKVLLVVAGLYYGVGLVGYYLSTGRIRIAGAEILLALVVGLIAAGLWYAAFGRKTKA